MNSLQELIGQIGAIKTSSDELSQMVAAAQASLLAQSSAIAQIVRGSRSGQDAVMAMSAAARTLVNASASMRTLSRTCEQCVASLRSA